MRESKQDITQLCESWWEQLADATRIEQNRGAEELLRLLGWEQPVPFTPPEGASEIGAVPYVLRCGGQTAFTACFVLPGVLEVPSEVVGKGIDFCTATRTLVSELRTLGASHVLISDFYRSYFYDARSDELLLHADQPKVFSTEIVPILRRAEVERGSLGELRRQPRSVVARRMREWAERWTKTIAHRSAIAEEKAGIAIDRLFVIRYLFDRDILRRTRWRLQQRFAFLLDYAASESPDFTGRELVHLFHDMWFDWKMDIFEGIPELDHALRDDAVAVPMLREFALLSRSKFDLPTILESFNHGDPTEKLRVRMVPEDNEERDHYLAQQSLSTIDEARIEIDLSEEGYRAIFHWFAKVTDLYERLEKDFMRKHFRNRAKQEEDMDLFAWSAEDAHRPNACADHVAHACERGFGIYYTTPQQHRVARLLLTLHLIDLFDHGKSAVNVFPRTSSVLMKRPAVLPAQRLMNVRKHVEAAADDYINYPDA